MSLEDNMSQVRSEGHFYSPIPDMKYLQDNKKSFFTKDEIKIEGIRLAPYVQRNQLYTLAKFYPDRHFDRYKAGNRQFPYGDAVVLQAMIRKNNPRRIIEIGSGHSTAVMLDTREHFNLDFEVLCIEPYPDRLRSILKKSDTISLKEAKLQFLGIDIEVKSLQRNDILFIDSSHVVKAGSELNTILFDLLPKLNSGVIIHFHDIFYPFEYPLGILESGNYWNESYFLRAFLMDNPKYSLELWSSYIGRFHSDILKTEMPECVGCHGGSFYIRKS